MTIDMIDTIQQGVIVAIIIQILTNIVVVAVIKKELEMMKLWVKDLDDKGTRAHSRIDDINAFLRNPNK
jgi:hypothetical protein